jgi:hypothetical protein
LITLVTVLAAALLGGVAATATAQANARDANGQIVFGRFSADLGDFQIFTADPDGTNQSRYYLAPPNARAGPRAEPGSWSASPMGGA